MISSKQEDKIIYEINLLVDLFLKTNASDLELSERTGISSSTVQRRLTDKERIVRIYPNGEELFNKISIQRKNNRENGKERGAQYSKLNNGNYNTFSNSKLKLNMFCKNKDEEMDLMFKIAIKYRLHLDTIISLFPYEVNEINEYKDNYMYKKALDYLFMYDKTNQEIAKTDFLEYYKNLLNVKKTDELNSLVASLSKVEEENYKDILNYQIKYALNNNEVINKFGIDKDEYNKNIYLILDNDPILKDEYINLALFMKNRGRIR